MPVLKLTDIRKIRDVLAVSQSKAATLLGVSTKAVQSYEQGLRSVPPHVQKTAAILLYMRWRKKHKKHPACWEINQCDPANRPDCPAFQHQAGDLCWMLTGTLCRGVKKPSRGDKLADCQKCPVMKPWLTC
jgi:DNA-binding XRE family transcriptional regulator